MVWWWFGVNMAGLRNIRNTNAFKFILQVFILSQKHIMGVKKVVWCGLDVVWWWFGVVWGVLGWFGVFPRTDLKVHALHSHPLLAVGLDAVLTVSISQIVTMTISQNLSLVPRNIYAKLLLVKRGNNADVACNRK